MHIPSLYLVTNVGAIPCYKVEDNSWVYTKILEPRDKWKKIMVRRKPGTQEYVELYRVFYSSGRVNPHLRESTLHGWQPLTLTVKAEEQDGEIRVYKERT